MHFFFLLCHVGVIRAVERTLNWSRLKTSGKCAPSCSLGWFPCGCSEELVIAAAPAPLPPLSCMHWSALAFVGFCVYHLARVAQCVALSRFCNA